MFVEEVAFEVCHEKSFLLPEYMVVEFSPTFLTTCQPACHHSFHLDDNGLNIS